MQLAEFINIFLTLLLSGSERQRYLGSLGLTCLPNLIR